jgi:acid phosphatase
LRSATTSITRSTTRPILRFITRRFGLPELFGNAARDAALKAGGSNPMGDLTKALNLSLR